MGTRYSHLGLEERRRLRGMMELSLSVSEIARRLGRRRSAIQRELARNRSADGGYRPDSAGRRAWARKLRGSKIVRSTRLRARVEDRLAMGWSPEQIAGRMELDGSDHTISVECIYRHAYSPAGRRAGLPRMLAQRKPKRGRRRRNGRREPAIPNRTPIHQSPTKAHLRSQFGHWEGDLVHFRRQRDILLTRAGRGAAG
jgi:IS30 family transposase